MIFRRLRTIPFFILILHKVSKQIGIHFTRTVLYYKETENRLKNAGISLNKMRKDQLQRFSFCISLCLTNKVNIYFTKSNIKALRLIFSNSYFLSNFKMCSFNIRLCFDVENRWYWLHLALRKFWVSEKLNG